MQFISDLTTVQVGDVLDSHAHGCVRVTDVTEGVICGEYVDKFGNTRTEFWWKDGVAGPGDHLSPEKTIHRKHVPDLWWPGVQIIPAAPPKRMKKAVVRGWLAPYSFMSGFCGRVYRFSTPFGTKQEAEEAMRLKAEACGPSFILLSEPFEITYEIEVEDND